MSDRPLSFLNRVLQPNGWLFISYANAGPIDAAKYQSVPCPQTFDGSTGPNELPV